ncbi:MAG: PQQ-binding-like beta-propeller repeat protein [Alphaproteobacteria bacterium]|nr:PQQ-binding-like beta-propeller repeat protein [Alphaproteobacteria bacterium]
MNRLPGRAACPRAATAFALLALVFLNACSLPDWLAGGPPPIKRAAGERRDVVVNETALQAEAAVADIAVEIPEQANLEQWRNMNEAMLTPHIGLTGVGRKQSATIGEGNSFSRSVASAPVVAAGMVFAMDAAGVVSAHKEADITEIAWRNDSTVGSTTSDALGGGLTYAEGVVYATTGTGRLRAIDAETGQLKWSLRVGAPVRGAPAYAGGIIVVLTADNQTLAYDAATGQPKWEQRGIREVAGYFSATSPVISDDIVVSAYSSGEVFALRLDTGSVLWNDTLAAGARTKAAAVFSGIDANPIVQEGVVVVTSAGGEMQASALLNGRPLWQAHIGAHVTPWSAGNVLFVLSDTHDLAAVFKRDGSIRWATSLAVKDKRDPNKDKTPPLYGPILSGNAVLVVDGNGTLTSFVPTTGERIDSYDLASGIVTAPIIVNGALYVITRSGKLVKYYY